MVDLLMEFGADPNARNLFGKTPIQLASPATQKLIRQYLEVRQPLLPFPTQALSDSPLRTRRTSWMWVECQSQVRKRTGLMLPLAVVVQPDY